MITIKDQRDIIIPKTENIFENNGFKLFKGTPYYYRKFTEECVFSIGIEFSNKGGSGNSLMGITVKSIENIIMEVGLPTNKLINQKAGKEFLTTIYDEVTPFEFTMQHRKFGTYPRRIKTEEDTEEWAEALKKYIQNEGKQFMEHYGCLSNVLTEMDRLEKEEKNWSEIIRGSIDHIFRGLIISKLCNDSDYERKLKKWEELICTNNKYEKWHSYFQKLKERLEITDAVYNV